MDPGVVGNSAKLETTNTSDVTRLTSVDPVRVTKPKK